jgi:cytochrome c-type biogenesis protein CcmH
MTAERKRVHVAIAVAVVAVGVTGAGLYAYLSRRVALDLSPTAVVMPSSAPGAPAGAVSRTAAPTMEASAERLAQRLKQKDGSGDDWALLARSYVQMGRNPDAVDAFGKALEKMPGNAGLLAEQSAARKGTAEAPAPR